MRNVAHLPWAILGTVAASTLLYVMLALALVLVVAQTIACPEWVYFVDGVPTINFIDAFIAATPGPRECRRQRQRGGLRMLPAARLGAGGGAQQA